MITFSALTSRSAPTHSGDRTESLPIRRHDGIEVPAAGLWPLLTSSYVCRSAGRRERQQVAVTDGWFDLDVDPAKSWLHLDLADCVIDLTVTGIADDAFGMSAWHLAGQATVGPQLQPVTMALRYHGVHRRGPQLWAWFSGTAVVGPPSTRRRSTGERLSLDLLFAAR